MFNSATILSASRIRNRKATPRKSAPQTKQQLHEKAIQRAQVQEEIDTAVNEWFDSTHKVVNQLAERFGKKPRYFLDIFFAGGARMVTHHDKVNAYNAFTSLKAQEIRDGEK